MEEEKQVYPEQDLPPNEETLEIRTEEKRGSGTSISMIKTLQEIIPRRRGDMTRYYPNHLQTDRQ